MYLRFIDINEMEYIINSKKIIGFCMESETTSLIWFQDGSQIEINKSIFEVKQRLFQLGIKVKEF